MDGSSEPLAVPNEVKITTRPSTAVTVTSAISETKIQVMEEDEPVIVTFSELISSDLKATTISLLVQALLLHAFTLKSFISQANKFENSWPTTTESPYLTSGLIQAPGKSPILTIHYLKQAFVLMLPLGGLNGGSRRVQQSIAAYFRGHEDEETKNFAHTLPLRSRFSHGRLSA